MEAKDSIIMYGADWCGDCRRAKALLDRSGADYEYINLMKTPDAAVQAEQISGRKNIPVLLFPDGSHLVEPSNDELLIKIRSQQKSGTD